jgi:hypothetical protein
MIPKINTTLGPLLPPDGTEFGTAHILEDANHNLFPVLWIEFQVKFGTTGMWQDGRSAWTPETLGKAGYAYYSRAWPNLCVEGVNVPPSVKRKTENG